MSTKASGAPAPRRTRDPASPLTHCAPGGPGGWAQGPAWHVLWGTGLTSIPTLIPRKELDQVWVAFLWQVSPGRCMGSAACCPPRAPNALCDLVQGSITIQIPPALCVSCSNGGFLEAAARLWSQATPLLGFIHQNHTGGSLSATQEMPCWWGAHAGPTVGVWRGRVLMTPGSSTHNLLCSCHKVIWATLDPR